MMKLAKPIFLKGLHLEKNIQAGFRKVVRRPEESEEACLLKITARTFYRLYVDGRLMGHGPARAAHGYARVDVLDLTAVMVKGREHVLAIELAGYNDPNVYVTGESSFLMAEWTVGDTVLAYTDRSWQGFRLYHRRQLTEAFSHARCLGETYDLDRSYIDWRTNAAEEPAGRTEVEELDERPVLLPRVAPLPDMRAARGARLIAVHDTEADPDLAVAPHPHFREETDRFYASPPVVDRPSVACSKEVALPFTGIQRAHPDNAITIQPAPGRAAALAYDFGEMNSGFIGIEFTCLEAGTLDLVFTDLLEDRGTFNPRRSGSNSVIRLNSQPGRFTFIAFEPHAFRYVKLIVRGQSFTVHDLFTVLYQFQPPLQKAFLCNEGELNRIYDAAEKTLIMNTLDVFMDCPGRERAGWLCDSFWSGRAARLMLGDTSVERAMLDNFLRSDQAPLAEGFFPVCYPSGFANQGCFIPNWPLFLILELDEYVCRSGDTRMLADYRLTVENLLGQFAPYENEAGLLENLPGYVFVEWSSANLEAYKSPVSVATNALYAHVLQRAGEIYRTPAWTDKADRLRRILPGTSFAGSWYADSLKRDSEGGLIPGPLFSEAVQYYVLTFAASERDARPETVRRLIEAHGPAAPQLASDVMLARAGVFIGYFLRFDLLARWGEHRRLLREMKALFSHMIDNGPGTLWEHTSSSDSVCHGFAAHASVWLVRDILGLHAPDELHRTVRLAPNPCGLKWCKGTLACMGGTISVEWHRTDSRFELMAYVPDRYDVSLELPPPFAQGTRVEKSVSSKGQIHFIINK
ncbi:alpha-L-rhamnosidase C-terminal domain-containing protein [Cohnella sp. GCM10012308]|uniref:alpha-L-rhamnosidase-related protein n=1 Tax=Cohnella sp. GCM10012308 TaxID=3317329 RepID=UPI00361FE712